MYQERDFNYTTLLSPGLKLVFEVLMLNEIINPLNF